MTRPILSLPRLGEVAEEELGGGRPVPVCGIGIKSRSVMNGLLETSMNKYCGSSIAQGLPSSVNRFATNMSNEPSRLLMSSLDGRGSLPCMRSLRIP